MGFAEDKVYGHILRNMDKFKNIHVASLVDSLGCLTEADRVTRRVKTGHLAWCYSTGGGGLQQLCFCLFVASRAREGGVTFCSAVLSPPCGAVLGSGPSMGKWSCWSRA